MRLRALVQNKVMLMLVDSGSSHTFVSQAFLDTLISDKIFHKLAWWVPGYSGYTTMRVIDLGVYDYVLGYDCLRQHSPILHDWENKTMQFEEKGVQYNVKGIPYTPPTAQELPFSKAVKWGLGNDIWAYAIVEMEAPMPVEVELPVFVQRVLDEFQDVFLPPTQLPPSRLYDHSIPIIPGSIPVNSRPYRYSPLHKDEIERNVKDLSAAGLITHNTSPYASPVLLVQKKRMTLDVFVSIIGSQMLLLSKIGFPVLL